MFVCCCFQHNLKGGSNDRLLSLLMPSRLISWGSANGNVRLNQVQDIKAGKHTETFKKHPSAASQKCCFSIVTKDRTLDFEVRIDISVVACRAHC
jgi:hypothetical protein